jgi:hypothetical protein
MHNRDGRSCAFHSTRGRFAVKWVCSESPGSLVLGRCTLACVGRAKNRAGPSAGQGWVPVLERFLSQLHASRSSASVRHPAGDVTEARNTPEQDLAAAGDDRDRPVEVVGHAARQSPNGLQLLRRAERLLRPLVLRDVPGDAGDFDGRSTARADRSPGWNY